MIHFGFSDLHTDPPRLEDPRDAILGVVGLFELQVDGTLLYSEEDFPLVEFARALNFWMKTVVDSGQDFEYESTEAAEPGLVWIRHDGDRWRIGSIFQEYPEVRGFSLEEIQRSASDLRKRLTDEARNRLGLDLAYLLESVV
jgi:hypothetical protein